MSYDREYIESMRASYLAQIESLQAQVKMLMDPIVQAKMLEPQPPMILKISDTETWNLARKLALNEAAQMFEALGKNLAAMQVRALRDQ